MNMRVDLANPPDRCTGCLARKGRFCAALSREKLATFVALTSLQRVRAGEKLPAQGTHGSIVGVVRSGALKLTRVEQDGRETISELLTTGDIFCMADGHGNGQTMKATADTQVCVATSAALTALADPETTHALLEAVGEELRTMENWLVRIASGSVAERVAYFILVLAKHAADGDGEGAKIVELPVSRRDIASFLRTTPESLSRQFQKLVRTGVVRMISNRKFVLQAPERLEQIAGD